MIFDNITVDVQLKKMYVFTGFASPCNDIGGVASSFQLVSSGGDRGSRMVFARERGGGRNATAANSLK
jgi:hypothetical protein